MAKNHPLMKDVKNWILDSFSFMDGIGYDILFDDDIYGMENTKAISADIDGLTDFDFEKGKKNLLNSIPNKIKAEFPYLRITSEKDGKYFVMIIILLDNNDYLEDKNIQYINLNESKESARKSIKENKMILSFEAFKDICVEEIGYSHIGSFDEEKGTYFVSVIDDKRADKFCKYLRDNYDCECTFWKITDPYDDDYGLYRVEVI